MFSQRSIRRFRPEPISTDDLELVLEAAVKAPSGGNRQPTRFLVLNDARIVKEFGALYREAWWAKRRDEQRPWTSREEIPPEDPGSVPAPPLPTATQAPPRLVLAFT